MNPEPVKYFVVDRKRLRYRLKGVAGIACWACGKDVGPFKQNYLRHLDANPVHKTLAEMKP